MAMTPGCFDQLADRTGSRSTRSVQLVVLHHPAALRSRSAAVDALLPLGGVGRRIRFGDDVRHLQCRADHPSWG